MLGGGLRKKILYLQWTSILHARHATQVSEVFIYSFWKPNCVNKGTFHAAIFYEFQSDIYLIYLTNPLTLFSFANNWHTHNNCCWLLRKHFLVLIKQGCHQVQEKLLLIEVCRKPYCKNSEKKSMPMCLCDSWLD